MGTAVSAILPKIRRRINETSTTFHTDEDLIAYVDEAQKHIVNVSLPLEDTYEITIVADVQSYSLPSNFLSIRRVTYNGKAISPTSFEEIDSLYVAESDFTGTPSSYYIWGDKIYFVPIPSDSEAGKKAVLYHFKLPATITSSTDSLEIDSKYDGAVLAYCVYCAYLKDKQFDMADYHLQECNAKIAIADNIKAQKNNFNPRFKLGRSILQRQPLSYYDR